MPKLELFTYWRSSCSFRVRIALAVKGLSYTPHFVNLLKQEQTSDEYKQKNPMGFVPALLVDGKIVTESVAMIELLDELFPTPPLYPKDPFARARVRALVETINAGTQPLQNMSVLRKAAADQAGRDEWARHFIRRGLEAFEALLARNEAEGIRGKYCYGDAITAADCLLVPQMYNARRVGADLSGLSRVVAASDAASALEAFQSASPERQPDAPPPAT
jgi:maleylacetoacetate isomerase